MSIEKNEFNQIIITYPQLYVSENNKYYLDYSSLLNLSGQKSTNLFRIIKSLENVPVYRYKNRNYYETSWCLKFWTWVSEANK